MRGNRTAYLAESVKLFSFITRASSGTVTLRADERNKCVKNLSTPGGPTGRAALLVQTPIRATAKLPVRPTPEIHGA